MASAPASVPPSSTTSADRRGLLVVISGPSGVGKSTVVEGLAERREFGFSVSATTRPPRPGEIDGIHYHFLSPEEFEERRRRGWFLEWADYGGHRYGTPRDPVEAALEAGTDLLLDIENRGALAVKEALPEAITIFLLPPDRETLEQRLRGRADTSEADVARRLAVADDQIAEARRTYDWLVTNDDVDAAIERIDRILAASERTP